MPDVSLRPVPKTEKEPFTEHFQAYLRGLAEFTGARPNRRGLFEYYEYDLYWTDEERMPFFIEWAGQRAGLLLLRRLPEDGSPDGGSLQLAEIYVLPSFRRRGVGRQVMRLAARMAEADGSPLTWSAYMSNGPANALYGSILDEFKAKNEGWTVERTHGIDRSGLARFYYQVAPVGAVQR